MACGAIGSVAVVGAAVAGRPLAPVVFVPVFLLSWCYSMKPLQLSYHRLGEAAVAVLFGPVTVLGGAYMQTGRLPPPHVLALSLPFGLVTAALLVANEVPDAQTDAAAGKRTVVNWVGGNRAYLVFAGLTAAAYAGALLGVALAWISSLALLALITLPLACGVGRTLRRHYDDKVRLTKSSGLMVSLHGLFCGALILGAIS
jgi:1,4-dihydroxy-2-naphthoate octaprenyltransferase